MLSLFGLGGVRRRSATWVAMLLMSALGATSGLAERLGLVRRGRCVSDDVSGGAVASGDSTISCGGGECASGVTPLGSNVQSCTVSQKFTLGDCGWGVTGGESVVWSWVMASKFCCPLRLVVPLRVAMRSRNALTIASAGVTVGCVKYLCLKYTVSDRQWE